MPYVVTQGRIITALEQAFNMGHNGRSAGEVRLATIADLEAIGPVVSVGAAGDFLDPIVVEHIDRHWFGLDENRNKLHPNGPTGWWVNWRGEADAIAREGMITALRMSMGLSRNAVLPENATALELHLMDFSWICPVPRFEVWIGRRTWPFVGKVVTVTLATPGYANFPDPDDPKIPPFHPLRAELDANVAGYQPNDHLVVGSETTTLAVPADLFDQSTADEANRWRILLNIGIEGSKEIVTHRPAVDDGIDPDGQSFQMVVKQP